MVGHLAPVPLSRRNVCLLHQKSPRHDQLTPARLTGTLGDINRLLTAAPGAEGKGPEQETPKLEEARSLLPLPLCTFLLVSQGAIINPFFLLPTHLPLSRFYPPENKKKKKVKRVRAGEPAQVCHPDRYRSRKSPNGVCVWDLEMKNENTRHADHAHSVDMTEVGLNKRRYSFEKAGNGWQRACASEITVTTSPG